MKTKTLPAVRIDPKTASNIQSALNKLNENQIIPITLQDFRRICYEYTTQEILLGKEIKIRLQL